MKKFILDVKTAVGTAPKTKDDEYSEMSKRMDEAEFAIRQYSLSVDRMKAAANSMSQAFSDVVKAFTAMTVGSDAPEGMKAVSAACEQAVKRIHDEGLTTYIKALDDEAVSPMKDMRSQIAELRKVEAARNRVMAEYDTYREAVANKEKEYEKKGKSLSESKSYQEEVAKRDELKAKFKEENTKFKEKANAISEERFRAFLKTMRVFSADTAKYFSVAEKSITTVESAAKKVELKPTASH